MKPCILFIALVAIPAIIMAQSPDIADWVRRLGDNKQNQCITRYNVYREIQKLDPAATILVADAIALACQEGDQRLQLNGRSVKSKFLFYNTKPRDSLYAAEMKVCLNENGRQHAENSVLKAEMDTLKAEVENKLKTLEAKLEKQM